MQIPQNFQNSLEISENTSRILRNLLEIPQNSEKSLRNPLTSSKSLKNLTKTLPFRTFPDLPRPPVEARRVRRVRALLAEAVTEVLAAPEMRWSKSTAVRAFFRALGATPRDPPLPDPGTEWDMAMGQYL